MGDYEDQAEGKRSGLMEQWKNAVGLKETTGGGREVGTKFENYSATPTDFIAARI